MYQKKKKGSKGNKHVKKKNALKGINITGNFH